MEEGCCGGGPLWEEGGVVVEGLGEGWDLGGGVGVGVWVWVWGGGCHGFFVVVVCMIVFVVCGGGVCIVLYWMEIFFFCSLVGLIGVLLGLCGTVSEA